MTKICLCLTGKTIKRDLEMIEKYRKYIDIAELRVDCLLPEELYAIRSFPELAGIPVILTVRRKIDGGNYTRGETARIVLLSNALAFPRPDLRHNFAYVDLEEDLDVPSLEEVARAFGTSIIRSFHNLEGTDADLVSRIQSLYRTGDEIAKAAVNPKNLDDVRRIFKAAESFKDKKKIFLAMGDMGQCTRILAPKMGAYLTYACVANESDFSAGAEGQIDPIELCESFHFRDVNADTTVYGISGYPLKATSSPAFFNNIFYTEKMNNVYVRFPSEFIEPFIRLAEYLPIAGASITVPHKTNVLKYLSNSTTEVDAVGACNTIVRTNDGWSGFNTDTHGFEESLLNFINKKNLKGLKCTIIGAGGAARAIAYVVHKLKGRAIILNRDMYRAKDLASIYGFDFAPLGEDGVKYIKKYNNIIIQTTSVGMHPNVDDPIKMYEFNGNEVVIDIIYKPEKTRLLQRALNAGCKGINGFDMLTQQAKHQYAHFFGAKCPV